MKIWYLDCDVEKYEALTWIGDIDIDEIKSYDGRSKKEGWKPVELEKIGEGELGNNPRLSTHIPVFDKKAVVLLEELIDGFVEILPAKCLNGEFFIINVTEVINCLDYKKSEFKTFKDGKRIMRFISYEFIKELVEGKHIFKIVDEPNRRPFVSDEFKKRVESSNLTGFKFELAWDSNS